MKRDEISILKSMMIKLDESTALTVAFQYHTENFTDGIKAGKTDRSKSRYRYIARVSRIADIKSKIEDMYSDEARRNRFMWPGDKSGWFTATTDSENGKIADWLSIKLKKMKTWEDGLKALEGWETATKSHEARLNPAARYEIDGYTAEDGTSISLTDKDALLKRVGQNLVKNKTSSSKKAKEAIA